MKRVFWSSVVALALGTAVASAQIEHPGKPEINLGNNGNNDVDNKADHKIVKDAKPGGGAAGNGIRYHGGPVMLGTTHIYYIWYGNWNGNTAQSILTNLAQSIGGSPYFNINTTYFDGSNFHVSNAVTFGKAVFDNYSQGTSLTDSQIQTVVSQAISSGALPNDTQGVYFVLTSQDVTASSGFCTNYCGWHTRG